MDRTYWINVRDKPAFLVAIMRAMAGEDAQIAFEGNLSNCDFSSIDHLPISGELHFWGQGSSSYVILPLTYPNIKLILKQVLPYGRVVHEIEHIQIQKQNKIQLLVGDNFHNECISVGSMISVEVLKNLQIKGIVRSFKADEDIKKKFS